MCWKIHDLELDAGDISHAVLSNGDIVLEVLFQISLRGRIAIFTVFIFKAQERTAWGWAACER